MMRKLRTGFPSVTLALAVGLIAGMILSGSRGSNLIAAGSDRSGDSSVVTGPITIGYDEGLKVQIPHEAVYLLDYKGGRLYATIPSFRKGSGPSKLIDTFVDRDLVADFKLDLENGPKPRFLMTTGGLGAYSAGWAPLYVFETATSRLAIYRVQPYVYGTVSKPKFELVELRSYAGSATPGQTK
jgi:hypothetical protein